MEAAPECLDNINRPAKRGIGTPIDNHHTAHSTHSALSASPARRIPDSLGNGFAGAMLIRAIHTVVYFCLFVHFRLLPQAAAAPPDFPTPRLRRSRSIHPGR